MCLIIYSPAGKPVERDVFDYAQGVNSDGIGIMSVQGTEKFVGKKCKKRAWRYLRQMLEAHPAMPYGVHFRWRTHGPIDRANTHPYQVPYSDAFVMHNGVLGITGDAKGESDTAKFVREYMPFAPDHAGSDYESYYQRIARIIGADNKFLVLHSQTGKFTLVNEDSGFWHEGLWYSNDYSVPNRVSGYNGNSLMGYARGGLGAQWWNDPSYGDSAMGYSPGQNVSTAGVASCTVDTKRGVIVYREPTADQYLRMSPEEQEYADSMVSDRAVREGWAGRAPPKDYYEQVSDENPEDYYDNGAALNHEALYNAAGCYCPNPDEYDHLDGCPLSDIEDVGGDEIQRGDEYLMAQATAKDVEEQLLRADYLKWWENQAKMGAV